MTQQFVWSIRLIMGALLLTACQARPIPTAVVPGTTFVLPLNAYAFGNAISKAQGIEDRQRGDLIIVLCPTATPNCNPTTDPPPHPCPTPPPATPTKGFYLGTRYVTTVMPSPASNAGLRGYMDFPAYSDWGLTGQDLAFLDVPSDACPGQYVTSVRTRPVGAAPGTEGIVLSGPNINVAAAPAGTVNPPTATQGSPPGMLELDVAPDLADLVPNPTVPLRLYDTGYTTAYPAAAEVEVTYPRDKVTILGAFQYKHLGINSMVNWRDVAVNATTGKVTLLVVDPKRCTQDLRIVFRLNGTATVNPLTDFTTSQAVQKLYDLNGSPITSNPYIIADSYSSLPLCGS